MTRRENGLYARLERVASSRAARPALTFLDARLAASTYTYGTLLERIASIAARLTGHSLPREAPVGILLDSQEAQILHYLAALSLDLTPAILTPPTRKLNRELYLETTAELLRYCRFSAVISDMEAPVPGVQVLAPFTLQRVHPGPAWSSEGVATAAFLQFSSGTTGLKKGVLVEDASVLRQLDSYAQAIELAPHDVIVSWLPLYHDMGFIACLNLPLARGIHTVMLEPLDWVANPVLYLKAVTEYRGTLSWHPNFAFAFMAERVAEKEMAAVDLSSLRGLINCSEPVTMESQERFRARFAQCGLKDNVFWGCYAMAETTFALTHGQNTDEGYLDPVGPQATTKTVNDPFVSVGRPLPGVEIRVVAATGEECPDGIVGELWVRSPFNFSGYYNNPGATVAAFSGDWYKTGDLGYKRGRDYFVCGRQKELIIVGGVNIYPQDIERMLADVPGIIPGRVAAFGEFDPAIQSERAVVLAETTLPEEAWPPLLIQCRQRLQAALQITAFDVHLLNPGWLIKSSSGKMSRRTNQERWQQANEGLNVLQ